jgi:superfamily II DNA/RNA helicase
LSPNCRLAILSLLCNHPECFNAKLHDRKKDARNETATGTNAPDFRDDTEVDEIAAQLNAAVWKVGVSQDLIDEETKLFKQEAADMESIDLSNKVKILCQILDASKAADDKVLVFSQSIPTLNFLDSLCDRQGRKYARLDGSTPMARRQDMIKDFNNSDTDIYLISTAAGGLGLNLQSANRVVIFDFKWNPIMEEQAVGRAYRIGQTKPTFVYRFVAGGTFEDSIHNKTVFKMQLASRVVDKKNPVAYATRKLGDYLFEPKDVQQKDLSEFVGMDPLVLDRILESQDHNPIIRAIVQSDTFERDDNDKLTAEELNEVKQLLIDEQLKRSNPRKWSELQVQRSLQLHKAAQQQGLALKGRSPTQSSGGSAARPPGARQGMSPSLLRLANEQQNLPGRPVHRVVAIGTAATVNASVPADSLPFQIAAEGSNTSHPLNRDQVAGPLPPVKPPNPAAKSTPSTNRPKVTNKAHESGQYNNRVSGSLSHRSGPPVTKANTNVRTISPLGNGDKSSVQSIPVSSRNSTTRRGNGSMRDELSSAETQKKVRSGIVTLLIRRYHIDIYIRSSHTTLVLY